MSIFFQMTKKTTKSWEAAPSPAASVWESTDFDENISENRAKKKTNYGIDHD